MTYQLSGFYEPDRPRGEINILAGSATVRYFEAVGTGPTIVYPAQLRAFNARFDASFTRYSSIY